MSRAEVERPPGREVRLESRLQNAYPPIPRKPNSVVTFSVLSEYPLAEYRRTESERACIPFIPG